MISGKLANTLVTLSIQWSFVVLIGVFHEFLLPKHWFHGVFCNEPDINRKQLRLINWKLQNYMNIVLLVVIVIGTELIRRNFDYRKTFVQEKVVRI